MDARFSLAPESESTAIRTPTDPRADPPASALDASGQSAGSTPSSTVRLPTSWLVIS